MIEQLLALLHRYGDARKVQDELVRLLHERDRLVYENAKPRGKQVQ